MDQSVFITVTALYLVFVVSTVIYIFKMRILLTYLKENHTKKWEELGRPTLIMNNSIENSLNILRFIWKQEDLNDKKMGGVLKTVKYLLVINLVLFAVIIVLFLISIQLM